MHLRHMVKWRNSSRIILGIGCISTLLIGIDNLFCVLFRPYHEKKHRAVLIPILIIIIMLDSHPVLGWFKDIYDHVSSICRSSDGLCYWPTCPPTAKPASVASPPTRMSDDTLSTRGRYLTDIRPKIGRYFTDTVTEFYLILSNMNLFSLALRSSSFASLVGRGEETAVVSAKLRLTIRKP